MDSNLPFGYSHKRTHSHMEHESSSSPTWNFAHLSASREPSASSSNSRPHVSGLHLPRIGNMPSAPPRRFPGDGFDYRRPVSSTTNFIDLTEDDSGPSADASQGNERSENSRQHRPPRLPRFGHNIIDLVDEELSPTAVPPPESPDIEIISSRRIDRPRPERPNFGHNAGEDDVEFLRENVLPESEAQRRRRIEDDDQEYNIMVNFIEDLEGMGRPGFDYLRRHLRRAPLVPPRTRGRAHGHIHVGFMAPNLDFDLVGFDLGMGAAAAPAPTPPTYDSPDKASEGFTRSPEESDVLVCPNCGDELCAGEDDVKRQVWVVKGCGHVYCGQCTANRAKRGKGKERQGTAKTKPFKECVVEGCGKKVASPKAMIQVFL